MKRLATIAVAVGLTCVAVMVNTAYAEHDSLTGGSEQDNGTEFHVVDDLYVGGWDGTWSDPDVEIYGFSMFGSTTAYDKRWTDWSVLQGKMPTTSTGAVVILGDLVVGSTAYFHRGVEFNAISTFTAGATFPTGSSVTYSSIENIWVNDGEAGWAIRKAANGKLEWYNPSQYGDNLGNHTATQNLNMNDQAIIKVSSITFSNESLAISSGSAYFGGANAGITVSTNVEVVGQIKAAKFIGNIDGTVTLTNTTPWRLLRVNDSQQVIDAGMYQEGSNGITVDASSFTVVNTALFKSSVTIEGDASGVGLVVNAGKTSTFGGNVTAQANLTVNGNSTLGDNPEDDTLTVKAHTTIEAEASPTSGKRFLQVGSGSNIVAYFKKK